MKIKTSELTGAALDWAVAKCEGLDSETLDPLTWVETAYPSGCYSYSTDWSQGGPIIEREGISVVCLSFSKQGSEWQATGFRNDEDVVCYGETPLIAAMRCYVASKLGDEVEVPDELCP